MPLVAFTILQVQMDVLSIVSNVQQVSAEELVVSQEQTQSSNRFALMLLGLQYIRMLV